MVRCRHCRFYTNQLILKNVKYPYSFGFIQDLFVQLFSLNNYHAINFKYKNKRNSTRPIVATMFGGAFMLNSRNISLLSRVWNGPNRALAGKQAEQKVISILKNKFPNAKLIEVNDVSGGCGAMFEINVVAAEFKGLNTIKQHRMINEVKIIKKALKEEIKDMHGIRIYTSVPEP